MRDFRELKVWQEAHQLTLSVYKATRRFPLEYFVLLARDLGYLSGTIHDHLGSEVVQVRRMLTVFIQRLKANGQRLTAKG